MKTKPTIAGHRKKTRFTYRVAGVCIQHEKVLLHCWETCAFWALPGGRVELRETSREALVREMAEETGLQVEVGRLLWIVENFYTQEGVHFHELGFYYLIAVPEGSALAHVDAEFTGYEGEMPILFRWVSIADVGNIVLYPGFLRTALADLPSTTEHIIHVDPD